jgi:ABC-type lipoprotein release transport system permease subunit
MSSRGSAATEAISSRAWNASMINLPQLFKMALRDLGRNRRRSLLSALAVAVGVALLLLMASIVEGEMRGSMQTTIRLRSGHLQVRAASYNEDQVSLDWKDLIADPNAVAAQIKTLPQVVDATPRLLASGIVARGDESRGVQVLGIDPASSVNAPFREGLLAGAFLTAEDRDGVLIGKPLADKLGLTVGDQINLLVNRSDGSVDQQLFTIRGVYSTRTTAFDENTVFMPLAKAQAITQAENHASTIFVMLKDREQAEAVAAALRGQDYQVLTWRQMNELVTQLEDFAGAYMVVLYLIVLGITATVVTNTLVMAVFERTREIGILSAIGMKGRRIMAQFLTEGGMLATGGVIGGLILGGIVVAYFNRFGFYVGNYGFQGMLMEDRIYAFLTLRNAVTLSITAYVITLIASMYPATLAARMEPVEALHAE